MDRGSQDSGASVIESPNSSFDSDSFSRGRGEPDVTDLTADVYSPSFPQQDYLTLTEGLNRLPHWTVYPKCLRDCLVAAAHITTSTISTASLLDQDLIRRLIRDTAYAAFEKCVEDSAVRGFQEEIQGDILEALEALVQLVVAKLGTKSFSFAPGADLVEDLELEDDLAALFACLNMAFDPTTAFHARNAEKQQLPYGLPQSTLEVAYAAPIRRERRMCVALDEASSDSETDGDEGTHLWLIYLINRFGELDGFKLVTQALEKPECSSVALLERMMLPFCQDLKILTMEARRMFMPACDRLLAYVEDALEHDVEELSDRGTDRMYNATHGLLQKICQLMEGALGAEEADRRVGAVQRKFVMRMLTSSNFNKHLSAVRETNALLKRAHALEQCQTASSHAHSGASAVQSNVEWLQEHKVVQQLLRANLHQKQYVDQVQKVLKSLTASGGLQEEHLQLLWNLTEKVDTFETVKNNVYAILGDLAQDFDRPQQQLLFQKLGQCDRMPLADRLRVMDLLRCLAETDKKAAMINDVVELLWNITMSADAPTQLAHHSALGDAMFYYSHKEPKLVDLVFKYAFMCVTMMRQGTNISVALFQLRQIISMLEQIPAKGGMLSASLINMLEEKVSLAETAIASLEAFMKKERGCYEAQPSAFVAGSHKLKQHLETINDFGQFLTSMPGSQMLTWGQLQRVWDCLVVQAVVAEGRDVGLTSFMEFATSPVEIMEDGDLRRLLLEKLPQLDTATFTRQAFLTVQAYFHQVNQAEGKLEQVKIGKDRPTLITKDLNLTGLPFLWQLALDVPSLEVSQLAQSMLRALHTNLSEELQQLQLVAVRCSFLRTCRERLLEAAKVLAPPNSVPGQTISQLFQNAQGSEYIHAAQRAARCLELVKAMIQTSIGRSMPRTPVHSASYQGSQVHVGIQVQFPPANARTSAGRLTVRLHSNSYVGELRQSVAALLNTQPQFVRLLFQGHELSSDANLVHQVGLANNCTIQAITSPMPNSFTVTSEAQAELAEAASPARILSLQPHFHGVLLNLADSCPFPPVKESAVTLLGLLPTDPSVREHLMAALLHADAAGQLRPLLLPGSPAAIQPAKLLYHMQALHGLLHPAQEALADQAEALRERFIDMGCISVLLDAVTLANSLNQLDASTLRSLNTAAYQLLWALVSSCPNKVKAARVLGAESPAESPVELDPDTFTAQPQVDRVVPSSPTPMEAVGTSQLVQAAAAAVPLMSAASLSKPMATAAASPATSGSNSHPGSAPAAGPPLSEPPSGGVAVAEMSIQQGVLDLAQKGQQSRSQAARPSRSQAAALPGSVAPPGAAFARSDSTANGESDGDSATRSNGEMSAQRIAKLPGMVRNPDVVVSPESGTVGSEPADAVQPMDAEGADGRAKARRAGMDLHELQRILAFFTRLAWDAGRAFGAAVQDPQEPETNTLLQADAHTSAEAIVSVSRLLGQQPLLVQAFVSDPDSRRYLLDCLLNARHDTVRQMASHVLLDLGKSGPLLMSWLLDTLIGGQAAAEAKPYHCHFFFQLLARMLQDMTQYRGEAAAVLQRPLGPLQQQLLAQLPSLTALDEHDFRLEGKLQVLLGLVQLTEAHALGSTANKGLVRLLLTEFLFPEYHATRANCPLSELPDGVLQRAMQARCSTKSSRAVAFSLLGELMTKDVSNLKEGEHLLMDIHFQQPAARAPAIPPRLRWNLLPHQSLRSPKHYVGLKNPAATCYMNAVFQQLFMQPSIRHLILGARAQQVLNPDDDVFYQLQLMFGNLALSNQEYYKPLGFWRAFKDYDGQSINVREHQDAYEFFTRLQDLVDQHLRDRKEPPALQTVIGGKFAQQIICRSVPFRSEKEEKFYQISLDVRGKRTLQESLDFYVQGELMEGDNQYFCEEAGRKVDAVKRNCIKTLPHTLVIHLKRFEFDYETMTRWKIKDRFDFPTELDMYKYTVEGLAAEEAAEKAGGGSRAASPTSQHGRAWYQYELKGVVVHSGTAFVGHYYSYIKVRAGSEGEGQAGNAGQWLKFDDNDVTPWDVNRLGVDCFGGKFATEVYNELTKRHEARERDVPHSAYMLFYERSEAFEPTNGLDLARPGSSTPVQTPGRTPANTPVPATAAPLQAAPLPASGADEPMAPATQPEAEAMATSPSPSRPSVRVSTASGAASTHWNMPLPIYEQIMRENLQVIEEVHLLERDYFLFMRRLVDATSQLASAKIRRTEPASSAAGSGSMASDSGEGGGAAAPSRSSGGAARRGEDSDEVSRLTMNLAMHFLFRVYLAAHHSLRDDMPQWNSSMASLMEANTEANRLFLRGVNNVVVPGATLLLFFVNSPRDQGPARQFVADLLVASITAAITNDGAAVDPDIHPTMDPEQAPEDQQSAVLVHATMARLLSDLELASKKELPHLATVPILSVLKAYAERGAAQRKHLIAMGAASLVVEVYRDLDSLWRDNTPQLPPQDMLLALQLLSLLVRRLQLQVVALADGSPAGPNPFRLQNEEPIPNNSRAVLELANDEFLCWVLEMEGAWLDQHVLGLAKFLCWNNPKPSQQAINAVLANFKELREGTVGRILEPMLELCSIQDGLAGPRGGVLLRGKGQYQGLMGQAMSAPLPDAKRFLLVYFVALLSSSIPAVQQLVCKEYAEDWVALLRWLRDPRRYNGIVSGVTHLSHPHMQNVPDLMRQLAGCMENMLQRPAPLQ
ncbi:hypothetical protein WJX72_012157 [[Myrmecia] bisecta]|uniref:ubiquitinyl hydrolase 1 n=1 Tax=[Myrmecia] bisecta TaxID=41462 RepID=A0AAW1QGQ9_9CHLO